MSETRLNGDAKSRKGHVTLNLSVSEGGNLENGALLPSNHSLKGMMTLLKSRLIVISLGLGVTPEE